MVDKILMNLVSLVMVIMVGKAVFLSFVCIAGLL